MYMTSEQQNKLDLQIYIVDLCNLYCLCVYIAIKCIYVRAC